MGFKEVFHFSIGEKINSLFRSKKQREEILEDLEELLISADISVDLVARLIQNLKRNSAGETQQISLKVSLQNELEKLFAAADFSSSPNAEKEIFLLVGVNGSGKTTTAAKLAWHYRQMGRNVLLAAADTFRAAGSSQLVFWGERLGISVVDGLRGSDPGSVVFNAMQLLFHREYNLLIVDTAGRVQSKVHLLKELEKLIKIIRKFSVHQPCEILLVIDASTGQNAFVQAEKYAEFTGLTGMILTKIDGTAKGGSVISIVDRMKLPIRYLGVGERDIDLIDFDSTKFVESLLGE